MIQGRPPWSCQDSREFMDDLHGHVRTENSKVSSSAVTVQAEGTEVVTAASGGAGELCAAHIHKMATSIIGSAADGGRTSGTTRLGCAETTGLGTTRL